MRRRITPYLASFGEALHRIASEYKDMERVRAAGIVWFDGVVYMAPLAKSEGRRLGEAIRNLGELHRLPAGHEIAVELVAPRGSAVLYAQIGASSAESATQILCSLMRRALDAADLTIDELHLEVERAEKRAEAADGAER